MSDEIPKDLRYTKEHEWARREGEVIVIGITAHAVDQLGDITMVSLPEVGTVVTLGESFGDIDSVKAVSELFAPISGEIVKCNEALDETPETINDAPYGGGWLLEIKPSDPTQLEGLLDAASYATLVADEG